MKPTATGGNCAQFAHSEMVQSLNRSGAAGSIDSAFAPLLVCAERKIDDSRKIAVEVHDKRVALRIGRQNDLFDQ
ncbi:MAG: hypothetical protein KDE32_14645 [Novosphingobium sp.]|nr:hypothetical protein [Novosphingobium sp.]